MTFIQIGNISGAPRSYTFTGTAPANTNLSAVTISGAGGAGVLVNNSSSLTATAGGYWFIFITVGGYNNTGCRIITEGVTRATFDANPNAPDFLGGVACHWVGFINAGGAITFQGRSATAVCNLAMTCCHIPTPANPK